LCNNRGVSRGRRELTEGAKLDRYELLHKLGEGGMAAVWLARLPGKRGFAQLVAIKAIKSYLGDDLRFEQMFLDEARIASRIRHPNVAQILDLGEEGGVLYLVMEWVEGESLARTRSLVEKRGGTIPLPIALRIIADAAAGLHAAHEQNDEAGANLGVIHRDVSPQNILVSTSGAVKVIDFGIAKAKNRAAAETTDGLLKGKIAYMSPEQAKGLRVDRRADIWALGVCLYELLTGRLPFDGDTQQEILRLLMATDRSPGLPATLPEVVRGVLTQALAPDPEERFLTAAALERAIETALTLLDAPTTSDDIARFLREACPSATQSRQEILAGVERKTSEGDGPVTRDVTPLLGVERTARLEAVAPAKDGEMTLDAATAPVRAPARGRNLAFAVVGAAMVGGLVYVGVSLRGAPAAATPASLPTAPAATSAAAAPVPVAASEATSATAAPSVAPAPSATSTSLSAPRPVVVSAAQAHARPQVAMPKGSAGRPAVRYDADGIPIGTEKKP
jgi:eukaryotic-like serine/threonine-protein kinase